MRRQSSLLLSEKHRLPWPQHRLFCIAGSLEGHIQLDLGSYPPRGQHQLFLWAAYSLSHLGLGLRWPVLTLTFPLPFAVNY